MSDFQSKLCTAFAGDRRIASGRLGDVALAVKSAADAGDAQSLLVFDDASGAVIDLDLRGSRDDILARLAVRGAEEAGAGPPSARHRNLPAGLAVPAASPSPDSVPPRGRGRPALGVVAREVTLLPRHWQWLAAEPGGASVTLRRLVEAARKRGGGAADIRAAREAAYRFIAAMAGDRPGFEASTRALFAGDRAAFAARTQNWPVDIGDYARKLAEPSFAGPAAEADEPR